jgi:hypothetical protein
VTVRGDTLVLDTAPEMPPGGASRARLVARAP